MSLIDLRNRCKQEASGFTQVVFQKRASFVRRLSFQIRLIEGTKDMRGETNDEPAGRPAPRREMLDLQDPP